MHEVKCIPRISVLFLVTFLNIAINNYTYPWFSEWIPRIQWNHGHHSDQHFVPDSEVSLTQGLPVYFW